MVAVPALGGLGVMVELADVVALALCVTPASKDGVAFNTGVEVTATDRVAFIKGDAVPASKV